MREILVFLSFIIATQLCYAAIVLPEIFSDNMVLQQNSTVKIWGEANSNSDLIIEVSWSDKSFHTVVDKNGDWITSIPTPQGSFHPQWIRLNNKRSKLEITNVLIGEVWFCSGQSNMEMYFKGFRNQPVEGALEIIDQASKHNGIRLLRVERSTPEQPVKEGFGHWQLSTPSNVLYFSAVAYSFALKLKEKLNVPVGIINSSFGGSSVAGWMRKDLLEKYSDIDLNKEIHDSIRWKKPYAMYNGMLKPYVNYTIKGFLWYQGEGSVGRFATYADKLEEMIGLWREEWGLGELPFYIVEITPYKYQGTTEAARLREAQFEVAKRLNSCEIVCTNDLLKVEEAKVAHPSMKLPIGQRLANIALKELYHMDSIQAFSPVYKDMEINDHSVSISFENCYDGLEYSDAITGFEVAGEDRVFHPAKANLTLDGNSVIVHSDFVGHPIAVRYCFKNYQLGNVKNSAKLPLFPFRTDRW